MRYAVGLCLLLWLLDAIGAEEPCAQSAGHYDLIVVTRAPVGGLSTGAPWTPRASTQTFTIRKILQLDGSAGPRIFVVAFDDAPSAESRGAIEGDDRVQVVEADCELSAEGPPLEPDDGFGGRHPTRSPAGLRSPKRSVGWTRDNTGVGAIVAILDSGVTCSHRDYCAQVVGGDGCGAQRPPYCSMHNGYDFADALDTIPDGAHSAGNGCGDLQPADYACHGTKVAGLVVSKSLGMAPGARILPVRFGTNGPRNLSTVIESLYYAAGNGARIINISVVWKTKSEAVKTAIAEIGTYGSLVVTAAASDSGGSEDTDYYPGAYAYDEETKHFVLEAAGVDSNDELRYISRNYRQDEYLLAALAKGVPTTFPYDLFFRISGTSASTAIVSGLVADVWQADPFQDLPPARIKCVLIAGSKQANRYAKNSDGFSIPVANLNFMKTEASRKKALDDCP